MVRVLLFLLFSVPGIAATTVYVNGKVHINDTRGSVADWLAVKDGKVAGFGAGKHYGSFEKAKKVDLRGRHVLPGLTDAHTHLFALGEELSHVDLRGAKSAEDAAARLKARAKGKGPILGSGWDQSDWPGKQFPDRQLLDAVAPDRPVVLYRIDGHAAWVNTAALKASKLLTFRGDPPGGKIYRRKDGTPTGVLIDRAMVPLDEVLEEPSDDTRAAWLVSAVHQALSHGITTVHEAGMTLPEIHTARRLLREGRLRFRIYGLARGGDKETLDAVLKAGPVIDGEKGLFNLRGVKLFADGAMGSRGAVFAQPYSDAPGETGVWVTAYPDLVKQIRRIDRAGFQPAVHAIGSLANEKVIDAFEEVLGETIRDKRPRLEHAQILTKKTVERMAKGGIIASMQPVHCTSDMKWVVDRIGKERARYGYAWRSVLDAGVPLAFGSDVPIELINPWHGIFAAVTRQSAGFRPRGGFFPRERITRGEAIAGFTRGAAFAAFAEDTAGTLEPGMVADFILMKKNPMKAGLKQLRNLKVEATYIDGKKVWPLPPGLGE